MSPPENNRPVRTASVQLSDGRLVELLYDPANERTQFAVSKGGSWTFESEITGPSGERLIPYRADNALLKHGVVLFPSEPSEYGTTADLIAAIRHYIHAYVDVSDGFEQLIAHYVLFSWVYDRFNELPYVRLHGPYGSGKTRFLLVVGAICRTPIFAGGASTTSPLFHMLDRFQGTLIIDEADFRFSDERAQVAKILNNGNARGFPVLRTEAVNGREFAPRAYQVFGPKLVAMRGEFDDRALESRFITERSDGRVLRADIPINLPASQQSEALQLRNMLLTYRLRRFEHVGEITAIVDPKIDARTNQIFSPLLSIIEDEAAREALRQAARERQRSSEDDRSSSTEAGVLATLLYLSKDNTTNTVPVADIAELYSRAYARDLAAPINSRWVGGVLRRAFGFRTRKSHGVYVLPLPTPSALALLKDRYRIGADELARLAEVDIAEVLTRVIPIDPYAAPESRAQA